MKLDIKSILIIVLLVFALFFGYKWYFGLDGKYKEKLNQLQKDYDLIELQKKESDNRIQGYDLKFDSLSNIDEKSNQRILELESDVKIAEQKSNRSKSEFRKLKAELYKTKKEIEEFRKNPPNRIGDDLLNSIKNNTK